MSREKRIKNEINKLQKNDYVIYYESLDLINIYLLDNYNMLYKITFKIPNMYPFARPNLFIRDKNYLCLLAEMSNRLKIQYNEKDCLCCNSILCKGIWGPTINILDIIKEVEYMIMIHNNRDIRKCYDKINLKRLLKKKLDINIEVIYNEIKKYI